MHIQQVSPDEELKLSICLKKMLINTDFKYADVILYNSYSCLFDEGSWHYLNGCLY